MFKLILKDSEGGEAQFPVSGELTIGREGDCDLILNDSKVSRLHAKVVADGDRLIIEDQNSSNGTFVNGNKIEAKALLNPGDLITIGINKIRVLQTNPLMDFAATTRVNSNRLPDDDMEIRKKITEPITSPRKGQVSVRVEKKTGLWIWLSLGGAILAVLLFLCLKG